MDVLIKRKEEFWVHRFNYYFDFNFYYWNYYRYFNWHYYYEIDNKKTFFFEDMIRSIFKSMDYKPNESQIKNIINSIKKN